MQPKAFVRSGRHMPQSVVLENEITEAIKNWLAAIEFHTHEHVGPMAGEDVGSRIDTSMRKFNHKLGLFLYVDPPLRLEPTAPYHVLVMKTHDHPVCLAPGLADLAQ